MEILSERGKRKLSGEVSAEWGKITAENTLEEQCSGSLGYIFFLRIWSLGSVS
jgi:hypothetical protein